MIRIKTIMDNLPSEQKSLKAEHGLSFYIETEDQKLLFDFGAGQSVFENLRRMGIDQKQITVAVGSHGHYDHAGGYPELADRGMVCPFISGGGYFEEKYADGGGKYTYLGTGFSEGLLEEKGIYHRICGDMLQIGDGCCAMGNFERTHEFEKVQKRFVIYDNGWRQDDFEDEICLVLSSEKGLVVVVGCSHPGILNILTTVQKRLGQPIYAVVGGTHLVEADEARIRITLEEMKKMGVQFLAMNHCSGSLVRKLLEEDGQIESVYLGVGDCLFFR